MQKAEQIAILREQLVVLTVGEAVTPKVWSLKRRKDGIITIVQQRGKIGSRICDSLQVIYKNEIERGFSREASIVDIDVYAEIISRYIVKICWKKLKQRKSNLSQQEIF